MGCGDFRVSELGFLSLAEVFGLCCDSYSTLGSSFGLSSSKEKVHESYNCYITFFNTALEIICVLPRMEVSMILSFCFYFHLISEKKHRISHL